MVRCQGIADEFGRIEFICVVLRGETCFVGSFEDLDAYVCPGGDNEEACENLGCCWDADADIDCTFPRGIGTNYRRNRHRSLSLPLTANEGSSVRFCAWEFIIWGLEVQYSFMHRESHTLYVRCVPRTYRVDTTKSQVTQLSSSSNLHHWCVFFSSSILRAFTGVLRKACLCFAHVVLFRMIHIRYFHDTCEMRFLLLTLDIRNEA